MQNSNKKLFHISKDSPLYKIKNPGTYIDNKVVCVTVSAGWNTSGSKSVKKVIFNANSNNNH